MLHIFLYKIQAWVNAVVVIIIINIIVITFYTRNTRLLQDVPGLFKKNKKKKTHTSLKIMEQEKKSRFKMASQGRRIKDRNRQVNYTSSSLNAANINTGPAKTILTA